MKERAIYLNNAAATWPKPRQVVEKVEWALTSLVSPPGRSSSPGMEGERVIFQARETIARFLGVTDSSRIVFTANATEALNLALLGLLREKDHVLTTSMDHNSVARPLTRMEVERKVEVERVTADPDGALPADRVLSRVRPSTRMVVLTHASNVTGTIQPVEEVAAGLRSRKGGRPLLLVDAAQTAGVLPLAVEEAGIDLLAAPGHKSLYGPQGTGFLYIAPGAEPVPLVEGGTGGRSDLTRQPQELPDRYEAGTPNTPGIAGLGEAVRWLEEKGLGEIRRHERNLTERMLGELARIPGVALYGPGDPDRQVAVVSFNLEGMDPAEVGTFLEEEYGINVRVGLHCSPLSHRTIGTFPAGTVRASCGLFNTEEDLLALAEGLRDLQEARRRRG